MNDTFRALPPLPEMRPFMLQGAKRTLPWQAL